MGYAQSPGSGTGSGAGSRAGSDDLFRSWLTAFGVSGRSGRAGCLNGRFHRVSPRGPAVSGIRLDEEWLQRYAVGALEVTG